IFNYDKDKSVYFLYNNKKNILLRKNGTSLYITQEIGTLLFRIKRYKNLKKIIYVVGNEQKEHFKCFFNIIKKIKIYKLKKLLHLSYNSVNYLGKKIKSRYSIKNKLILIDDLIIEMNKYVNNRIIHLKKKNIEKKNIDLISLGAIKYQFLKVNPNKIINFNINNTLQLEGNTGIYLQYTYVRILSILKKYNYKFKFIYNYKKYLNIIKINEKQIIIFLIENDNILKRTINKNDPSILINYIYKISKIINNFYNKNKIIKIKNIYKKNLRLILCKIILNFLKINMKILGIPIINKI
ncbi:MAG: DALR anticodon-binding domain-containing protein, partial [Candidatus Shikimatogenerans sp. JK-2022]|nr:DALR anticodon-binding domain-containing protein [Candidatus Shikimatogenerans bostrichidophilus]